MIDRSAGRVVRRVAPSTPGEKALLRYDDCWAPTEHNIPVAIEPPSGLEGQDTHQLANTSG